MVNGECTCCRSRWLADFATACRARFRHLRHFVAKSGQHKTKEQITGQVERKNIYYNAQIRTLSVCEYRADLRAIDNYERLAHIPTPSIWYSRAQKLDWIYSLYLKSFRFSIFVVQVQVLCNEMHMEIMLSLI